MSALTRAYALCAARFYDQYLTEMAEHSSGRSSALREAGRLNRILYSYVDRVCEPVGFGGVVKAVFGEYRWIGPFREPLAQKAMADDAMPGRRADIEDGLASASWSST